MKYLYVLITLLLINPSYASLNKWVDDNGKIYYSDSAPPNIKTKRLKSSSDNSQSYSEFEVNKSAVPAKTIAEQERERKKRLHEQNKAEQKVLQDKENETNKRRNCENARANLSTLDNSPQIVTYNEQGEKIYMDDATRDIQREVAIKAVTQNCN